MSENLYDEYRAVIVNLIRCLEARGGIKIGDKIKFDCRLTKLDYAGNYQISESDINIDIISEEE